MKGEVSVRIPKLGSDAHPSAAAPSLPDVASEPAEADMLRVPSLGPLPPGATDDQAFVLHFNADRVRHAHAVPTSLRSTNDHERASSCSMLGCCECLQAAPFSSRS